MATLCPLMAVAKRKTPSSLCLAAYSKWNLDIRERQGLG